MILDGKNLAKQNELILIDKVEKLKGTYSRVPCLKVVLVGESQASIAYVTSKKKACSRVGIDSEIIRLPIGTTQQSLICLIEKMNKDDLIDGVLIQLPLPIHMNETTVLNSVSPDKDVDGLHTINGGKLFTKQEGIVPATPLGVMMLLDHYKVETEGKHAVIIGRSNLVGMPLSKLLLDKDATVTVLHRRSKDLKKYTLDADILLVAVGKPLFITKDMVKKGSVVIDVGINRVDGKLVGDVDFEAVKEVASLITPVPGGVGPMTISALLFNVIKQFELKQNN